MGSGKEGDKRCLSGSHRSKRIPSAEIPVRGLAKYTDEGASESFLKCAARPDLSRHADLVPSPPALLSYMPPTTPQSRSPPQPAPLHSTDRQLCPSQAAQG